MNQYEIFERESGGCRFRFLPTGDIAEFSCGDTRVNCFEGTPAEGSAANIWLRQYQGGEIVSVSRLWGARGKGRLARDENGDLAFVGTAGDVRYRLAFLPLPGCNAWVWRLALRAAPGRVCDVVYGQDIGVADRASVLNNELYVAQYLGHHVFETDNGFAVGSRQNRPQAAGNRPCLQQGMLRGRAVGYSTDATQFFGLAYKGGAPPRGLWQNLDNQNYQFELSYTALQSESFALENPLVFAFYGLLQQDHPQVMEEPLDTAPLSDALDAWEKKRAKSTLVFVRTPRRKKLSGRLFTSAEMKKEEIHRLWPHRELEEHGTDGELWSFFTPEHDHIVLQAKELSCVRPHAHIIMTAPDEEALPEECMASTNTMYGVFNAQTVIGNTSMHKLISVHRGLLNQLKYHGQRLWVKLEGKYRLLGLPAVYEMGLNWARWRYLLPEGDRLEVLVFAAAHRARIALEVRCEKPQDLLLATQLVMGDQEFQTGVDAQWQQDVLRVCQPPDVRAESPYPGLHYDLHFDRKPDGAFFEDSMGYNETLLTCAFHKRTGFVLTIAGALEEAPPAEEMHLDFMAERAAWEKVHAAFTMDLRLSARQEPLRRKARQLEHTAWWFVYDALVHYASPHGLEQTGGAAWGTRDVCQGPFELFMATGHFALARNLLLCVFSHQRRDTGQWPQWFMFDRYDMHEDDCHGDVVFWPLKCLATYLLVTGDNDILTTGLPWQDAPGRAALSQHLRKAFATVEARILPGTCLISYAGGDWDDTLQPAHAALRNELVSSWTQALAAETMGLLADALSGLLPDLAEKAGSYARKMAAEFNEKLVIDGVVAGLARVRADGAVVPMLHPADQETGIHYRLLPLIRSIIADLVTQEQKDSFFDLIEAHLKFPDGVHLMDRPVRYTGGNSHLFQRAEQDANVGREVGLMYTHAHIRYIEALVKAGRVDAAWDALFIASPIAMQEMLPSAMPRQSNVYHSSSDALFLDRYAFQEGSAAMKEGNIPLLGGWRLYSSGPGLWFTMLLRHVLGIQATPGSAAVSHAPPAAAAGTQISFRPGGRAAPDGLVSEPCGRKSIDVTLYPSKSK